VRATIDAAAALKDCQSLNMLLAYASATSQAHERATGVPNDALEEYIQTALRRSGCA